MNWRPDKNRPLCPQICERLCLMIAMGEYAPDERILSVREMAVTAGVNPNTVQRSFEMLEQQGIIYSVRGSGWYVGKDTTLAKNTLESIIKEKTEAYFAEMQALGQSSDAIKKIIEEWKI